MGGRREPAAHHADRVGEVGETHRVRRGDDEVATAGQHADQLVQAPRRRRQVLDHAERGDPRELAVGVREPFHVGLLHPARQALAGQQAARLGDHARRDVAAGGPVPAARHLDHELARAAPDVE